MDVLNLSDEAKEQILKRVQHAKEAEAEENETPDFFEVLVENWKALSCFQQLATQWRIGFNGATGLDYTAVINFLQLQGGNRKARKELFEEIQLIEAGALAAMSEAKRKEENASR